MFQRRLVLPPSTAFKTFIVAVASPRSLNGMDDDLVFLLPEVVDRAVTTPSVKATCFCPQKCTHRIINMKIFTFTNSL